MAETKVKHDQLTSALAANIESGIKQITEGNLILLAEESGTKVNDIDKVLKAEAAKDESELPETIVKSYAEAQAYYKSYRESLEAARNLYRTDVLHEEPKAAATEDDATLKANLQEVRKVVMDAIGFVKSYSHGNGKTDIFNWATNLQIPQVGRQGTSSVGVKKPRVFVSIGEGEAKKVYGSFGEVAAFLSDKDNKVVAGDVANAWNEQGAKDGAFTFKDVAMTVTFKPKKSDEKAS